ncbi:hypothetical protein HF1_03020 [Mycoplasma haemofelis str. Langford 1]|uniref:Uncharacterized protein n=1 Tax=Mycoplasma haemofelis (strain Langford 1) TaxID=941640 RepID=E8ZGN9_MYCHL|nr:hypothetical protein [Mycoplasma haemofelis]CBY92310.1 hypothetical protein HF1_03020 [Mycoplasma haemofelis str. Langford 1]
MTSLSKAALGFSAAGTTAAGALYMGGAFKGEEEKPVKTAISKLLKELNPKKRLIESSVQASDAIWKAAWKAYRTKNKDSKVGEDAWKLKGWTTRSNEAQITEEEAPSHFIQACSDNGKEEVIGINDDLYKEVLEFCTRDASIKDWISDAGRSAIGKEDTEGWKKTWKLYRAKNKNIAADQDTWKVSGWNPSTTSDDNVVEDFKTKCTSKLDLKSSDSSFDEEYPRVLEWCTK